MSAPTDETDGYRRGAVHIVFLNADGSVLSSQKLSSSSGLGLADNDYFGRSGVEGET